MATRTIVTSQPDVACDVCERRLLRGENHDVFIVAGRRRTVCELCAPRAVHEGWMRESEQQGVSLPPTRPRRGRSLFTRLRQLREDSAAPAGAEAGGERGERGERAVESEPHSVEQALPGDEVRPTQRPIAARPFDGRASDEPDGDEEYAHVGDTAPPALERDEGAQVLAAALSIFNSSEHPRRVAGVTRSLGAPEVSVRSAEHARSVVRIVVAWELCWYRYQVDLDELDAVVEVMAQGTELSELAREERVVNAFVDSSGLLALA